MTQKELAEKLNISDKTVSRWERDDGAPDLSVIPVLAEIFGVSCDELLRGERRPLSRREEESPAGETSPKGEKQRQHLLAVSLSRYKTRTYIAMGLSLLGLIAAAICNIAFLRAYLGFLVGAVFYTASAVCQAVFWNGFSFSIAEENPADDTVNIWKRMAIRITERTAGVTVALFGFTVPLLLGDTYSGIVESWPLFGMIGTGVFLLLYGVVLYFLNNALLQKGVYTLSEAEEASYRHNRKLQKKTAGIAAALLLVTAIAHIAVAEIWTAYEIMDGIRFDDYESFVLFMEQDIPYSQYYGSTPTAVEPAAPPEDGMLEEPPWTLTDKNGEVVCTYYWHNTSVIRVNSTPGDGTALPVTVYTQEHLRAAQTKVALHNGVFVFAYAAEIAGAIFVYCQKRTKPPKNGRRSAKQTAQ